MVFPFIYFVLLCFLGFLPLVISRLCLTRQNGSVFEEDINYRFQWTHENNRRKVRPPTQYKKVTYCRNYSCVNVSRVIN